MEQKYFGLKGLTSQEVQQSRESHGSNSIQFKKENKIIMALKDLVKEPMIILLLVAASIYFISGDIGDGIFMAASILLVATISLYQESRSRNALEKLKDYTRPHCKVIRNGDEQTINNEDLVIDDLMIVEEGSAIPADGTIVQANDFSVNESVITGESFPVSKDESKEDKIVYSGTIVTTGLAVVKVTAIGKSTKLGQIGQSLEDISTEKTPLEKQIANFVKKMVILGAVVFVAVWIFNYINSGNFIDSLLKSLTLAMSILPEEIPVAFTTFMALGAWRLMKMEIIVKQMKTVETLGSATVICTDKTGTITENKMTLARVAAFPSPDISNPENSLSEKEKELVTYAMWASEPIPFDPMEIALHSAYKNSTDSDKRPDFKMVHEYPLGGKPPMMTHVFEDTNRARIIAAKGAPEAMMKVSGMTETEMQAVNETIANLAKDGFRVLGVGHTEFSGNDFPKNQQDLNFTFDGIVAFYDPPKKNITDVFNSFYNAGIDVKIVTGDNALTTAAIAKQVGFKDYDKTLSGEELMHLSEEELKEKVMHTAIFTRMFPEAKLKIINALKACNQVVAMTGDGVNDGPALKASHIGIAMGKKGTEIAKEAASLILPDDDLAKMVDAIGMGRKIYTNLKKAIQYIISIHIPIILTVSIPLVLGWVYPNIFSPVHVIFLELIMGPTCSIIYENEPMEKNTMNQKPRPFTSTFFNIGELTTSIIQGLAITAGTLGIYLYAVSLELTESHVRTLVFVTLISANVFLTLVNRSFYYSVITSFSYKNRLIPLIIGITILLTFLLLYADPLVEFFEFSTPSISLLGLSILAGFISVIWFEIVKWTKRLKNTEPTI
ncbi:cation-translocating P-type ATPase [Flavobacterium alkalisoli]|uniref:Cation-translocating P-type ATPase n=1 Tax=Flavobacterium alkalisoli TaxID=2602769 RepID=A0A5B9FP10_9FLAO|nr:cation-translocating P-type ATPase [Flavobacterium alkalisoli]QEE48059.1 cation-translocating P-type ATPase [Flavobacterium alkalisoli]